MKARSFSSLSISLVFACAASSTMAGGQRRAGTSLNDVTASSTQKSATSGCNGYHDPTGHTNLQKTMPSDVCVVSSTSVVNYHCDEDGNPVSGRFKWVCIKYATRDKKFHAVYEMSGVKMGQSKIFLVAEKTSATPEQWQGRHELWATGENTSVTWMSDRASRQYASNGGSAEHVIAKDSGLSHQPSLQQAKADCGRFNGLSQIAQRIACEAASKK